MAGVFVFGDDGHVGDAAIEGVAQGRHLLQALAPVRRGEQRTLAVAREARELDVDGSFEIHDESARREQLAIVPIEHGAAAGGEDDAPQRRHLRQRRAFAAAESRFAFEFEDQRNGRARMRFDDVVEIVERQLQLIGDGACLWSSCRHPSGADQEQVRCRIHAADASTGILARSAHMAAAKRGGK